MLQTQKPTFRNWLLDALPADELGVIEAGELVELELQDVLVEAGGPTDHVYFPESGIISVVAQSIGDGIEVGVV
ncbi:MAG: hypothetical protein JWQ97_1188, partial [Phenylobacterium sp.]|nr:hypothetical protein [Phenylobacterium sp.]